MKEATMMEEKHIDLIIQQDEDESVFLQRAVKAALQGFRKINKEERRDKNPLKTSQPLRAEWQSPNSRYSVAESAGFEPTGQGGIRYQRNHTR